MPLSNHNADYKGVGAHLAILTETELTRMAESENSKLIPLSQGQFAIVDEDDYELLMQWKWYASVQRNGSIYADRNYGVGCKKIRMHRVILNAPPELWVDHINSNTLDNRKKNLRLCTNQQNQANRQKNKNSLSKYKGVSWSKSNKKWQSQLTYCQKKHHIGFFDSENEAAIAYNVAALKLHGEFAKINILKE